MWFCVAGVALCDMSKVSKLEEVSHQMLVLLRPRVSSRVSGFPVASPCLWGKLHNLSFSKVFKQVVMSFCVAGVWHFVTFQPVLYRVENSFVWLAQQSTRLPRKMTMDTSKVLRLPRKMQRIFGKRRESIAPAAQKPFFDTLQNTSECHEVPRLPRETKQRDV